MTAKIINGRVIGEKIRSKIKDEVRHLQKKYNIIPNITTVKIGENPESNLYLRLRDKACSDVGIQSNHLELSDEISENELLMNIEKLNKDNSVHGILIQLPLPKHISFDKVINLISPLKDVEGINPYNIGRLLLGDESIVPCTAYAVITILEEEKTSFKGADVVIINHSNIVGKPLTALFLNRNSTVNVCHVFTKDLKNYTRNADIIITGTGIPKLIKKDHIKKDAFVVDVGIVQTKNGVCGDVDFDSVKDIAGKITPVPGGVGPVTIACSLINMVKTYKNHVIDEI